MGDTSSMSTPGTEAKLLVVDDEPNIRDLLASSLRFAGFDVVTAEDGSGAFHEAQASRPDLIVLDVMLPDMYGACATPASPPRSSFSPHATTCATRSRA